MSSLRPRPLRRPTSFAAALVAFVLASCDDGAGYSANPPSVAGGLRPAEVVRPTDYDPSRAYPLVLLLHGYGANGFVQDIFFGTRDRVDALQYLLVIPEGVKDETNKQYWNAGPCCAFGANPPDDVAYLTSLVEEVSRTHHVDRSRVFALGHSNGGAMAFKLACAAPETFAAIGSLAGIAPETEAECPASTARVSVLTLHGDLDDVVLYDGTPVAMGIPLVPYPSAPETIRRFAAHLGCDTAASTTGAAFDLGSDLAGAETTPTRYQTGCAPGTSAELWTIAGGGHIPYMTDGGKDAVLGWLLDHGR